MPLKYHVFENTMENGAFALNFQPYIRRYTSPNENFEYRFLLSESLQVCPFTKWGPLVKGRTCSLMVEMAQLVEH